MKRIQVRVADKGSVPQGARVLVQGVPAVGVIDSGSDITIMGGKLFQTVATVARLRKRDFQKPDRTPRTYDQKPFHIDGKIELDIEFSDKTMKTSVYVKLDAHDQLLLSEGVCRQLGIISYHKEVQPVSSETSGTQGTKLKKKQDASVPMVRVSLVQSLQILPHQSILATVHLHTESGDTGEEPLLMEHAHSVELEEATGLQLEDTLLRPTKDGLTQLVISNPSGYSMSIESGTSLGEAVGATVVAHEPTACPASEGATQENARKIQSEAWRKQKLCEMVGRPEHLCPDQIASLHEFLCKHHEAFSLEENERGETDLVEMEIHTGDAPPRKVPARRMPFAVRQEVAKQLRNMQDTAVIEPSCSPWASPVVMVRKKDGTHQFCVDYRELNAVTKADTFPLPRIDDLLDQLGKSRYFSTLDLASGFWQIRVSPGSREKTAFVTPQGLYEF